MNRAILVTGDRWANPAPWAVWIANQFTPSVDVVIHGDCRGIDRIAAQVAERMEVPRIIAYPYDGRFGKAGGPIRNRKMIDRLLEFRDEGYQIAVMAFHPNLAVSGGTNDCVTQALERRVSIPVYWIDEVGRRVRLDDREDWPAILKGIKRV